MDRMYQIGFCSVVLTLGTWLCRFACEHIDAWWWFVPMAAGLFLLLLGLMCVVKISRRW